MKFEVIVGNPPYSGNLHLKIINTVINHLTEEGVASFIHPARWLQDPLAEYKKGSDKVKFKNIVDRLDDVNVIDTNTTSKKFNIVFNGDLMISKINGSIVYGNKNVYSTIAQEASNIIIEYSKNHNIGSHEELNKVDGWRCQIKEIIPVKSGESMTLYSRKSHVNLFQLNKENVFFDGFNEDGVEWMKTRKQKGGGTKQDNEPFPHSIKFNSKEEALNFESSCNTNFYNNIIYMLKNDQHVPLKFLPWMEDYSHPWTDEDYCKFFGNLGMSEECKKWMCRYVYDYRIKDFINYEKI